MRHLTAGALIFELQKITAMNKTILKFGLLAGIIVSAFMTVSMFSIAANPSAQLADHSMLVGYLSMLIAFSLIYVAVKKHRDDQLGGSISFGKAFRMGLLIAFIAATLYVAAWAVVYQFFLPDFLDLYTKKTLAAAAGTASPTELQAKAAEMEQYKRWYKNPFFFALLTYAEILPVGLVVSLICALILKRKKPAVMTSQQSSVLH